ncbi:MAG: DUF2892 domain-containing protein [Ignavibacteriae bacterium HGW-Ignavibacteriae-3]|nr:MAG: DUF2892 domain-containing protein [Ignavibacteriae bacterium HGW-Ignavibacteriae-3]
MKKNVGNLDKTLRIVGGLVIIGFGVLYESWWGAVGIIPLFTATTGWCPMYLPFGISTCKTETAEK